MKNNGPSTLQSDFDLSYIPHMQLTRLSTDIHQGFKSIVFKFDSQHPHVPVDRLPGLGGSGGGAVKVWVLMYWLGRQASGPEIILNRNSQQEQVTFLLDSTTTPQLRCCYRLRFILTWWTSSPVLTLESSGRPRAAQHLRFTDRPVSTDADSRNHGLAIRAFSSVFLTLPTSWWQQHDQQEADR